MNAPVLPRDLVSCREGDQMREAFQRDRVPVVDVRGDRLGEGHWICHQQLR